MNLGIDGLDGNRSFWIWTASWEFLGKHFVLDIIFCTVHKH